MDTAENGPAAPDPSRTPRVSGHLVGRTGELDVLVAAALHPPSVVVVEGEAGVGKTRLLAELSTDPRLEARRVLRGSCRRVGAPFPLGPFVEALRDQSAALAPLTLPAVTGGLRAVVPELASVLPPALEPLEDPLAERHRVFRALADLLASLGPVVLIIEDLHLADAQTVELVGHLVSAPPPGLTLVTSLREEELAAWVRAALAVAGPVTHQRLRLAPLDVGETRALASAILGVDDLSEEFAAYLWERAAGTPFVIEELLALLQARGTLIRQGSRWVRRALDRLDVPHRIRDTVLERVDRLGPAAREVLDAASVLDVPQPVEILVATCRGSDAAIEAALGEALAAGLLEEEGNRLGFRHVLAAQSVYEHMPGLRRRGLHARAAAALASSTQTALPADERLAAIAHHLHHAGRLDAWAVAAERAAARAVDLYDDEQACRLLADVLREAPLAVEDLSRVALGLARVANNVIPEIPDLVALLAHAIDEVEAAGEAVPGSRRGELRLRFALQLEQTSADPGSLRRVYLRALTTSGTRPCAPGRWSASASPRPTVSNRPSTDDG